MKKSESDKEVELLFHIYVISFSGLLVYLQFVKDNLMRTSGILIILFSILTYLSLKRGYVGSVQRVKLMTKSAFWISIVLIIAILLANLFAGS